MQPGRQR
jgi:hypothetical protein